MQLQRKWQSIIRIARLLNKLEWFGVIWTGLFIVLMFVGPYIAPQPTETFNPNQILLPPSLDHLFGTDENGMDIFSRIIVAPRVDVSVGLSTAFLAVMIGIPLGVLAGFFEGSERRGMSILGQLIVRLLDVVQSFPVFILALVLVAVRGAAIENILVAITFVNVPLFLRLSRSELLSLRERLYAEAARAVGNTDIRIAFRHLLPNALGPLMNQISVTVGFAILLTAGLSFVGAGIAPPKPELGAMVATGAKYMLLGKWWVGLFPGIFLGLVVFVFAVTGDTFDRLFQPGIIRKEDNEEYGVSPEKNHYEINELNADNQHRKENVTSFGNSNLPGLSDAVPLLKVKDLIVEYKTTQHSKRILNEINLQIFDGETVGIVGESGSGKSILVRSLLMLLPDDMIIKSGELIFKDLDLRKINPNELRNLRGTEIAALLPGARMQLNPVIKVGEMMKVVITAHKKIDRAKAHKLSLAALEAVGIPDPIRSLDSYQHELSGGMAQRVCIAMALLHKPSLIIADEPTSGLDVTVNRQVLDLMGGLSKKLSMSQLIVTRDLGIIAQYCDRVAVIEAGRIVEIGSVDEVFMNPQNPYTVRLIRSDQMSSKNSQLESVS